MKGLVGLVSWPTADVNPQTAANRRIRRIFVLRRKSADKNSASAAEF